MTYRVYLVDDDKFLLGLYAAKFKDAGHEVRLFPGGEELLADLRKRDAHGPDLILIDTIMPGMTGFETLKSIRKEDLAKEAKIVILTNQGQESDVEMSRQLGADGYIIKAAAIPSEVFAQAMRVLEGKDAPDTTVPEPAV